MVLNGVWIRRCSELGYKQEFHRGSTVLEVCLSSDFFVCTTQPESCTGVQSCMSSSFHGVSYHYDSNLLIFLLYSKKSHSAPWYLMLYHMVGWGVSFDHM